MSIWAAMMMLAGVRMMILDRTLMVCELTTPGYGIMKTDLDCA
jgi:hypothetical protein